MQCGGVMTDDERDEALDRLRARLGADTPVDLLMLAVEHGRGVADWMAALAAVDAAHAQVDRAQARLIDMAREDGVSWSRLAVWLGLGSGQSAQYRYRTITGTAPPRPGGRRTLRQVVDEAAEAATVPRSEVEEEVRQAARALGADGDLDAYVTTSQERAIWAQISIIH